MGVEFRVTSDAVAPVKTPVASLAEAYKSGVEEDDPPHEAPSNKSESRGSLHRLSQ
jgi:hypothetical protein